MPQSTTHKREWRINRAKAAYRLIAEQHVDVGHDLHEVVLEELADEGCREIQAKQLVVFRSVLCNFQDGLQGDGQEETLKKNDTGSRRVCSSCLHTSKELLAVES